MPQESWKLWASDRARYYVYRGVRLFRTDKLHFAIYSLDLISAIRLIPGLLTGGIHCLGIADRFATFACEAMLVFRTLLVALILIGALDAYLPTSYPEDEPRTLMLWLKKRMKLRANLKLAATFLYCCAVFLGMRQVSSLELCVAAAYMVMGVIVVRNMISEAHAAKRKRSVYL